MIKEFQRIFNPSVTRMMLNRTSLLVTPSLGPPIETKGVENSRVNSVCVYVFC